jgi:choline dehydrogenase-like flavoprotein
MLRGVQLIPRAFVSRIDVDPTGRRATGVRYLDPAGQEHRVEADTVVIAASAIETARLLLLSASSRHPDGLGNRSGQVGRNLMFHLITLGLAIFDHEVHAWRGPSTTFTLDDFVGPERVPGSGLPYLKGGICEVGGTLLLMDEANLYAAPPDSFGRKHKDLMRQSPFRAHLAGMSMVGEDMPQERNRVDLDPRVRDVYGFPVPRITHSPHRFETAASAYYGPKLAAICQAAPGAVDGQYLPVGTVAESGGPGADLAAGPAATAHIMGTARMGHDPRRSVTDRFGRVHELDNLYLADGSVFTSSGGFNPTLTIMALSLRMARHLAGSPSSVHDERRRRHRVRDGRHAGPRGR